MPERIIGEFSSIIGMALAILFYGTFLDYVNMYIL